MKKVEEGRLLRVFVGENHRFKGMPLFEAIIHKAKDAGLGGTTILKGIEGFGSHGKIHTIRVLRVAEDMPIVIEIVDTPEKIDSFLPLLDEMMQEGIVTIEDVKVIRYSQ
ncbi:MAG TPA: DUF190 domain-containing protein [Candidatus Hypogeohydataceae bacterium YC38]